MSVPSSRLPTVGRQALSYDNSCEKHRHTDCVVEEGFEVEPGRWKPASNVQSSSPVQDRTWLAHTHTLFCLRPEGWSEAAYGRGAINYP